MADMNTVTLEDAYKMHPEMEERTGGLYEKYLSLKEMAEQDEEN